MRRKIVIDPIILIGYILIIIALAIIIFYYIYYDMYYCTLDPVEYANNHSNIYYWDRVIAIRDIN